MSGITLLSNPTVIHAKDFGALGDGSANDTTALQAALDAAEAAGGGTVFIPIGTFLVKQLTVASKVHVIGAGWGSILARLDNTTNYLLKNDDEVSGNTDIIVENLAFDGKMSTDGSPGFQKYGMFFGKVTRLVIQNCYVHDFCDGGIAIREGSTHVKIVGNTLRENSISDADGETNLAIISASNVLVEGNIIDGPTTRVGMDLEPNSAGEAVDNILVANNLFINAGKAAFTVTSNAGSVGKVSFIGNDIINCNMSVVPSDATIAFGPSATAIGKPQFFCVGNRIHGGKRHGILSNPLSSASTNVISVIQDNHIYDVGQQTNNTYDGILCEFDRNVVVRNNAIVSLEAANKIRYGVNLNAVSASAIRRVDGNVVSGAQTGSVFQPTSGVRIPIEQLLLDTKTSTADVASTTAETQLYSYIMPAGTLGLDRGVRLQFVIDYLNNSGGASNITLKVKLGSTTIFNSQAVAMASDANRTSILLRLTLMAKGSASQVSVGEVEFANASGAGGVATSAASRRHASHNAITENGATSLDLQLTGQHSVSSANVSVRVMAAKLELL